MTRRLLSLVGLLALTIAAMAPAPSGVAAEGIADLGITHVSGPHSVDVGQLITFHIGARNNGPDASELDVVTELSSNLEFVEMICDFGISPDTPACEYSNVPPHRSTTTLLVARVIGESGAEFSLGVTLSNEGITVDPNPANDVAQVDGRIR